VLEEVAFINCTLTDCDLYYSGGDFDLVNTKIDACRFHWRGHAKNTATLMQMMQMSAQQTTPPGFQTPPGTRLN